MNVEIAQRLAELRRERGFSQEGLAEQLGLSRQAVSKWERAESAPDMGNLIALADLYEVTLDELLRVSPEVADDVRFESQERAESVETEAATLLALAHRVPFRRHPRCPLRRHRRPNRKIRCSRFPTRFCARSSSYLLVSASAGGIPAG